LPAGAGVLGGGRAAAAPGPGAPLGPDSRAAVDRAAEEAADLGMAQVIVTLDVDHLPPGSLPPTAARAQAP